MLDKERIYTIPLRKETLKVPRYARAKKSVKAVRNFLIKHTKNNNVKIGKYLHLYLYSRGRQRPPVKVQVKVWPEKVKVKKQEIDVVRAELVDAPVEKVKETKEVKLEEKVKEVMEVKKEDKIKEEQTKEVEKEKKEILEHPPKKKVKEEKKEKSDPAFEKVKRLKKDFPKDEKPSHERKASQ